MSPATDNPATKNPRLLALDALRGFDMFWIIGADALVQALKGMSPVAPVRFLAGQLDHKAWAGFGFYDLIFPLFVFIVGVSLVYSLTRTVEQYGRAGAVGRILRRTVVLILLGIFYNGGLTERWPDIRLAGVLQRIALAYAATGLLFCFCRPRTQVAVCGVLLAGYWALMTFVPIRDLPLERSALAIRLGTPAPEKAQVLELFEKTTVTVTGRCDPGLNLANHLDFQYLPGAMYDTYWDPEGLLSTLPAIATCLLGVFAGRLLRRADWTDRRKVLWLGGLGAAAVLLGFGWGLQFPVVKKIWTSSFVLVAGGWSALLLGIFYYAVEMRQWRRWCQPFVWIGTNPITIYLATVVIDFHNAARRLVGGDVHHFLDANVAAGLGELVIALIALGLAVLLVRFLYARKIFLRV